MQLVSVHFREFGFQRDDKLVRENVSKLNIDYPVAVDQNGELWDAYKNRIWPAIHVIDKSGNIRYQKFGGGRRDGLETAVKALLAE